MRGFILAAGKGERLRPLTFHYPKAALPVMCRPVISYAVELLARAGIYEIGVNLYWLSAQMEHALRSVLPPEVKVRFFREKQLLGTAGGLKNAEEFLKNNSSTFVVLNADTILDLDLKSVIDFHHKRGTIATMVVKPSAESDEFGVVGIGKDCKVVKIAPYFEEETPSFEKTVFCGVHILEKDFFNYIPAHTPSCIMQDFYFRVLKEGKRVSGYKTRGFFADIGTPLRYLETNFELLKQYSEKNNLHSIPEGEFFTEPPVFCAQNIKIEKDASVGPWVIIGKKVKIGKSSSISFSAILDKTEIKAFEKLQRCIAFPKGRIQC